MLVRLRQQLPQWRIPLQVRHPSPKLTHQRPHLVVAVRAAPVIELNVFF